MNPVEFPLAFGHWQVRSNRLRCRLPHKTVDVSAPGALLTQVLQLCTGRLRWEEVAAGLARRWSPEQVDRFLVALCGEGVVIEASEAVSRWRKLGEFPAAFHRLASAGEARSLPSIAQERLLPGLGTGGSASWEAAEAFAHLLKARESHRTFADAPLSKEDLATILWAAHGVTRPSCDDRVRWHRTTGSGGNLHASRWFVAVLRDLPSMRTGRTGISRGLHEARFHLQGGTSLDCLCVDVDGAWATMLDPRPLRFASAVLLPVWDLRVETRKYGNRATVFATFEAGQCLQNAQLMAAALGAACVVRGDTCESAVLQFIGRHGGGLAPDATPLAMPALVVGSRPSPEEAELHRRNRWVKVACMSAPARAADAAGRFAFRAGPVPVGDTQVFTSGRAADPQLAATKAEAEAWERLGWAMMARAEEGSMRDVQGSLDPRAVVAYSAAQYRSRHFPCLPFTGRRSYLWVAGHDVETGVAVKLPAECVHALTALPQNYQDQLYTSSTTSGAAAWTDPEGALLRATLELVERDAFLRCWIAARGPSRLRAAALPLASRHRLQALDSQALDATVCQVESSFASVICVHLRSRNRPFSAITAAAAFDVEDALDKALSEAEGRADHMLHHPAATLRHTRLVQSPEDIHRLYQSPAHFRRPDFFASGPELDHFLPSGTAAADWPQLRKKLLGAGHRLLAFDITPDGASLDQGRRPLHVVRAFATGMLPIWFHHALAPAGLAAFARERRNSSQPRQRLFIHPFT